MSRSSLFLATALVSVDFFLLTAAMPALAQDGASQAKPEEIVVTATRVPTPISQIANSITVITAADIAIKQEQTLPDVLKDVPGLNIVQTGGPGGQTSVFMRGTNSNHVKVLVDGIDVSDVSNSNASFDFGQFLTPDIERVEVLRGPQSGLYGADAIGGVINIITKTGNGAPQFTAGIEGGSFGTFNQSAGVSGSTGPFHYTANIEHFRSDDTPVTPLDLLAPGDKRIDDSYDNVTASTKLGLDVTDNFDLGLVGRYTNSHLDFTGDNYATFPAFPDSGAEPLPGAGVFYARHRASGPVRWQVRADAGLCLYQHLVIRFQPGRPDHKLFFRRPEKAGLAGQGADRGRRDAHYRRRA